jgi:hypothetical protein
LAKTTNKPRHNPTAPAANVVSSDSYLNRNSLARSMQSTMSGRYLAAASPGRLPMTTTALNALNSNTLCQVPIFKKPVFAKIHPALPELPSEGSLLARSLHILPRAALAAIPFTTLVWMFLSL